MLKRDLSSMHDFDPFFYYYRITQQEIELNTDHLVKLARQYEFNIDKLTIECLLKQVTRGRGSKWTYSDFLRFVYSSEHQLMKFTQTPSNIEERKKKLTNYSKLNLAFLMVLLKEREFLMSLAEMQDQLKNANIPFLFSSLTSTAQLNIQDFLEFTRKYQIICTSEIADDIISRFDINNDGRTTFDDFASLLLQECPVLKEEMKK